MTYADANKLLLSTFNGAEREFLFQRPEFAVAVLNASTADVDSLSRLGTTLLLTGGMFLREG